jgi:nicotinamidase-related amidase
MEQNNSSDLLLVIDMQNVYTKGQEWACKGIEHASASIHASP